MTGYSNKFILTSYILTDLFCYPKYCPYDYFEKLNELRSLDIKYVILEGNTKLNNGCVLGKGSEGLVLKVQDHCNNIKAAKIRRTDSSRLDIKNEFSLYQYVNDYDIGPKVFHCTRNILLMECLDGLPARNWFLTFNSDLNNLRQVIVNILNQCYTLDKIGIDHGQLNKLDNHVIISSDGSKCTIVDFESASKNRKVNNVTSVLQGLLFRGIISKQINKFLNYEKKKSIFIDRLTTYKSDKSRQNFDSIITLI
jgi:putative serine/threonine protein kinase